MSVESDRNAKNCCEQGLTNRGSREGLQELTQQRAIGAVERSARGVGVDIEAALDMARSDHNVV